MEGWSPVKSENIAVFIPAYVQIIESALYEEEDVTSPRTMPGCFICGFVSPGYYGYFRTSL